MIINRYNYEEYFLLYTDNELNATERQAVREFVEQNPDLGKELEALQGAVLKPDREVGFENKERLMQFGVGSALITVDNYREFFISYVDNELSQPERTAVERFLTDHTQFQQEFELFQKLKLSPESAVVFPLKESLYRKEAVEKPVSFAWWKIAAAATVILLAGTIWLNNQDAEKASPVVAKEVIRNVPAREGDKKRSAIQKSLPAPASAPERTIEQKENAPVAKKESQQKSREEELAARPGSTRQKNKKEESAASEPLLAVAEKDIPNPVRTDMEGAEELNPLSKDDASKIESSLSASHPVALDQPVSADKAETRELSQNAWYAANESSENVVFANIPVDNKPSFRRLFRKASRLINKPKSMRTGEKSGILIGNIEIAFQ